MADNIESTNSSTAPQAYQANQRDIFEVSKAEMNSLIRNNESSNDDNKGTVYSEGSELKENSMPSKSSTSPNKNRNLASAKERKPKYSNNTLIVKPKKIFSKKKTINEGSNRKLLKNIYKNLSKSGTPRNDNIVKYIKYKALKNFKENILMEFEKSTESSKISQIKELCSGFRFFSVNSPKKLDRAIYDISLFEILYYFSIQMFENETFSNKSIEYMKSNTYGDIIEMYCKDYSKQGKDDLIEKKYSSKVIEKYEEIVKDVGKHIKTLKCDNFVEKKEEPVNAKPKTKKTRRKNAKPKPEPNWTSKSFLEILENFPSAKLPKTFSNESESIEYMETNTYEDIIENSNCCENKLIQKVNPPLFIEKFEITCPAQSEQPQTKFNAEKMDVDNFLDYEYSDIYSNNGYSSPKHIEKNERTIPARSEQMKFGTEKMDVDDFFLTPEKE